MSIFRNNIENDKTYMLNWDIQLQRENVFHGRMSKYGYFRFGFFKGKPEDEIKEEGWH